VVALPLAFWKMDGTGNDFIVVDNRAGPVAAERLAEFAARYCPRRTGVGADGVLLVEPSPGPGLDFRMRYLNADGSEADMCGNGARCIARFAHAIGAAGTEMRFLTGAGPVGARITEMGAVIDMPAPTQPEQRSIAVAGRRLDLWFLSTGVPHAVVPVTGLDSVDVVGQGRAIRYHETFLPAGTNVNYLVRRGDGIAIRTYERGVEDETLACGTGASASALVAATLWNLRSPLDVVVQGGRLRIHFARSGGGFRDLKLEGPAVRTYRGELDWPE
jgi:diaminopimelate epimerase